MRKLPEPGDVYLHQNGLAYTVLALALDQDAEQVNVIHQGANGATWSRPIGNFMAMKGGEYRFVRHQSTDAACG